MTESYEERTDNSRAQRLEARRGKRVSLTLNGKEVSGFEGEYLSGLLMLENVWGIQLDRGRELGVFCNIGQCHGCMVKVEGIGWVRACRTPLKAGMVVHTGGIGEL